MTPEQIINDVADHYGITPGQLIHGDRHHAYTDPRHVAAYCLRIRLRLKYKDIGEMLGGKCHATIIYAVNKVGDWMRMPQINRDTVYFVRKLTDKTTGYD